jgi:hypothetical protein
MSTDNYPLPAQKEKALRKRRNILESVLKTYTIYEMFDPPLKSKEEIEQIKFEQRQELSLIVKVLKENSEKKAKIALAKRKASGR